MPEDLWHLTYREFYYLRQGFEFRDELRWLHTRRLYGATMNKGLKRGKPDDYWWELPTFDKRKSQPMSDTESYKAAVKKYGGYLKKVYGKGNSKDRSKEAQQAD